MNQNRYTPQTITEQSLFFCIPLYQRLFEWTSDEINQLLSDLKSSFDKDQKLKREYTPYYIGMLTSTKENDLVDGQQRFTVMMLLGIVLKEHYNGWQNFLITSDDSLRLTFFARKNDEDYLKRKTNREYTENEYINRKMEDGITVIQNFMQDEFSNPAEKENFAWYVYSCLTFFVSKLPESYSISDLNKYFETMNSTGRNLESHEILKVKLLKQLPDNKNYYTRIWNAVAQMDRPLIRRRNDKEEEENYYKRYSQSIRMVVKDKELNIVSLFSEKKGDSAINDFYKTDDVMDRETGRYRLKDIKPNNRLPQKQLRSEGYRAIMNFSEFILQVLYLTLPDRESVVINDFFDVHKLLTTFEHYGKDIKPERFIWQLLKYRLLFDYYIIRVPNSETNYVLEMKEDNTGIKETLEKFESMLYVNSTSKSYYLWFTDLMEYVNDPQIKLCKEVYSQLKIKDDKRHPQSVLDDNLNLTYGKIDRYWFWRLDFYLWKRREEFFKGEQYLMIAANYRFRRNRSIEHIAPQHPKTESKINLIQQDLDRFGNLVMISSGLNSSLQNESYEVKKAHVASFLLDSVKGTIESLTLLLIHLRYENWNELTVDEHENSMIEILKESYQDNY